jgi:hypothetical protein
MLIKQEPRQALTFSGKRVELLSFALKTGVSSRFCRWEI